MTLGKKDKAVIEAFTSGNQASGHKLSTDGVRLDGHWMGGSNIAEWVHPTHRRVGMKYGMVIELNDLGSHAAQTVHRAIRKAVPANWLSDYRGGK